jgi:hypothetical protein
MAKLEYSVYVAPSKLVASDDFPPGRGPGDVVADRFNAHPR